MTITWLDVSACGLSNTGFIRAWGVTRAAKAWRYCARPISAPSGVTAALLLIFCALKGATRSPRSTKCRHSAVTRNDFPASLVHPMIMIGVGIARNLQDRNFHELTRYGTSPGGCFYAGFGQHGGTCRREKFSLAPHSFPRQRSP